MLAMVKSFETKGCTLSSGAVPCKFIHKHMLYCYDDADNDDDEDNMYTPLTSRVILTAGNGAFHSFQLLSVIFSRTCRCKCPVPCSVNQFINLAGG